jgi:hypothetical protein
VRPFFTDGLSGSAVPVEAGVLQYGYGVMGVASEAGRKHAKLILGNVSDAVDIF